CRSPAARGRTPPTARPDRAPGSAAGRIRARGRRTPVAAASAKRSPTPSVRTARAYADRATPIGGARRSATAAARHTPAAATEVYTDARGIHLSRRASCWSASVVEPSPAATTGADANVIKAPTAAPCTAVANVAAKAGSGRERAVAVHDQNRASPAVNMVA